jgi:hypothetical protein
MPTTKNLGVVKALFVGSIAPTNQAMLWLNTADHLHYYYNTVTSAWVLLSGGGSGISSINGYTTPTVVLDPDDLSDVGSTNKFYNTSLFDADFTAKTTDDLTEGVVNLYYTAGRFDTDFAAKTTDDLPEGATNKYFNATNVRAQISATAPVAYNASTGVISMAQANATTPGWISAVDWNIFNNKMNVVGGTAGKIARFAPTGNALGDSTIFDDGTNVGFGIAASATAYLRASYLAGGSGRVNLWKSSFATSQNNSTHFDLTTQSAVANSIGLSSTLTSATAKGYAVLGSAFETSIGNFSNGGFAGVIGQAQHTTLDAYGVVGFVNGVGAGTFYAGYFKATNSGSGSAYALRLEEAGVDNTDKFLKILDSAGRVGYVTLSLGTVTSVNQQTNHLTKWTSSANEITSSQFVDDGTSTALGASLVATTLLNTASATHNIGINLALSGAASTTRTAINVLNTSVAAVSHGIYATVEGSLVNLGGRFVASDGSVPTYASSTYDDLLLGSEHSTGILATALSSTSTNYGIRVRVDQTTAFANYGIYIRTRNGGAGTSFPLLIDSGNQGAGKVLTSDANGKADWATPATGTGDVLIGTSRVDNYLTKWDTAAPTKITASQMQDDGTTLSIGTTLSSTKYLSILSNLNATTQILSVSATGTSGNKAAIYGEAIGATGGINVGGHFKAINGGTNYALRLENGNNNTGLYLKVLDSNGNIGFSTEVGLGTVTDQGGTGGTLHKLTKWTGSKEVGDSAFIQHATAGSIAIGGAASATSLFLSSNTDETFVNAIYGYVGDVSATTRHRAGYFVNESINTNINEGLRAAATNSSLQNIAHYAYAGPVDPTTSTTAALIGSNVGIVGFAGGAATNNTAGYFGSKSTTTLRNYGLIIEAANAGAGDHFAMKIIDGNQAAGYVLTSDLDGNAYWAASAGASLTGSGTAGKLARWTTTTNLGDSLIRDNGSVLGFGSAVDSTVAINSTSAVQYGMVHINTYASTLISYGAQFAATGTRATGTNVGQVNWAMNNSNGNVAFAGLVNTSSYSTAGANEDISFLADGTNQAGHTFYGIKSTTSGAGTLNVGGYFKASGATANYAIYTDGGGVRLDGLPTTAVVGAVLSAINVNGLADWKVLSASDVGAVGGSGTINSVSKWITSTTLGDSLLVDDGTTVGVGNLVTQVMFNVAGGTNTYGIKSVTATTNSFGAAIFGANTSSTTAIHQIGIHGKATGAVAGSIQYGMFGGAGTYANPSLAAQQIGLFGIAGTNSGQKATAIVGYATESHAGNNYGILVYALNAGAGESYIGQFQDSRTEGTGKFLKSIDNNGTAEWAAISAGDVSGLLTGTGLNGQVTLWDGPDAVGGVENILYSTGSLGSNSIWIKDSASNLASTRISDGTITIYNTSTTALFQSTTISDSMYPIQTFNRYRAGTTAVIANDIIGSTFYNTIGGSNQALISVIATATHVAAGAGGVKMEISTTATGGTSNDLRWSILGGGQLFHNTQTLMIDSTPTISGGSGLPIFALELKTAAYYRSGALFRATNTTAFQSTGVTGESIGVSSGTSNIGVAGTAGGNTNFNVGVSGLSTTAGTGVNIGGQFEASGGASNYALKILDGNQAAGHFLLSDASGYAAWGTINSLTTDSTPDGANDYVATYDASANLHKKVLINTLVTAGGGGGGGGSSAGANIYMFNNFK